MFEHLNEQPNYYCKVEGCPNPQTHTTPGHKCSTCGKYGHGDNECGNLEKINALPKRSDGSWKYDIYPEICMPIDKMCKFPRCGYKWSHTCEYHHCSKCGFNHHSSNCLITNKTEWRCSNSQEYNQIYNDLLEYNNVYCIFATRNGTLKILRKKNDTLNFITLLMTDWLIEENLYIFDTFILNLSHISSNILESISETIEIIDIFENLDINIIKCPICRTLNDLQDIQQIKGLSEKCSICYENPVQNYFPKCQHACVCDDCLLML